MRFLQKIGLLFKQKSQSCQDDITPASDNNEATIVTSPEEIALENNDISLALAQELKRAAYLFSRLEQVREESQHLSQWVSEHHEDWLFQQHHLKQQLQSYEKTLEQTTLEFQATESRLLKIMRE
jgi:predicted O-linked N-acetylglucosamine transferase (SPINDLY family)